MKNMNAINKTPFENAKIGDPLDISKNSIGRAIIMAKIIGAMMNNTIAATRRPIM